MPWSYCIAYTLDMPQYCSKPSLYCWYIWFLSSFVLDLFIPDHCSKLTWLIFVSIWPKLSTDWRPPVSQCHVWIIGCLMWLFCTNSIMQHRDFYVLYASFLGADLVQRCHLTSTGNPVVEIRWSSDGLMSTMGFPIMVRRHLYTESWPRSCWLCLQRGNLSKGAIVIKSMTWGCQSVKWEGTSICQLWDMGVI